MIVDFEKITLVFKVMLAKVLYRELKFEFVS